MNASPDCPSAAWEQLHEAQWAFVLDFYARPGVSQACLDLQDHLGVDVPVLLHAIWLHCAFGITPDAEAVAAFEAAVRPWREEVVRPLRGARRYVKAHPFGLPPPFLAGLRQQIADAELGAERGAFAILAALGAPDAESARHAISVAQLVRHFAPDGDLWPSQDACKAAVAVLQTHADACRAT